MTRVNPRAYAFRAAAELYQATGKPEYRADLEKYFSAWVRDFHDPIRGGFYVHGNVQQPGDHKELGSFKDPGGQPSAYDGSAGVKGNDGTVYALSSVLLEANAILTTPQTLNLVRESMDLLLGTRTATPSPSSTLSRTTSATPTSIIGPNWRSTSSRRNGSFARILPGPRR